MIDLLLEPSNKCSFSALFPHCPTSQVAHWEHPLTSTAKLCLHSSHPCFNRKRNKNTPCSRVRHQHTRPVVSHSSVEPVLAKDQTALIVCVCVCACACVHACVCVFQNQGRNRHHNTRLKFGKGSWGTLGIRWGWCWASVHKMPLRILGDARSQWA